MLGFGHAGNPVLSDAIRIEAAATSVADGFRGREGEVLSPATSTANCAPPPANVLRRAATLPLAACDVRLPRPPSPPARRLGL